MDQQAIVEQVRAWGRGDDNIRAVVLTGSVARGDHDDLSDVDIELYVRDPWQLLASRDWYEQFGDVLAVEELPNVGWMPTRLLYLVDGKIDFAIGDVASLFATPYSGPFRLVLDKDHRAGSPAVRHSDRASPPSAEDFDHCVNWFSAAALMQAKLILRGEPWQAKYRDWDLKGELLRMITWDHKRRYGWDYRTWYQGKGIDHWCDADIRARLDSCWAGFPCEELIPALHASMDLFHDLAERTADALGLPTFHHDKVRQEVGRILASRASH